MDLKGEVEALLNEMGKTPDEVAETLKANNIKGVRNTVRSLNPLVRYIQDKVRSEAVEFDLMKGDVVTITMPKNRREEAAIPDPLWQFLFTFHRGGYPDLELPADKT